jgi:hypothetical protein
MWQRQMKWKLFDFNKSYNYILPILGGKASDYIKNTSRHITFVNCFVGDENYPEFNKHIFLLYKYSSHEDYKEFEYGLQTHPLFVKMYDPATEYVMYIFRVPEEYQEDYQKFREGAYSKYSNNYKQQILNFYGLDLNKDYNNAVIGVLYKLESGFNATEAYINKNVPKQYWIKIPRNQEASSKPELEIGSEIRFIEIFQNKLISQISVLNE